MWEVSFEHSIRDSSESRRVLASEGRELPSEDLDRPRRSGRRRITYLFLFLAMVALFIAAAPAVWIRSPMARPLIQRQLSDRGWEGDYKHLAFGWLTPLRLSGVDLVGTAAGTRLRVEQLDCDATLLGLFTRGGNPIHASANGVRLELSIRDNGSSLETDLLAAMGDPEQPEDSPGSSGPSPDLQIDIQNLAIAITDTARNERWAIDQARGTASLIAEKVSADFSGIVSESRGGSGSIDGSVQFDPSAASESAITLSLRGLPLRIASLVRTRFPEQAASLPAELSGDATGAIRLVGSPEGSWSIDAKQFEVRNLIASDPRMGDQIWRNDLAVIDGLANLQATGLTGRGFRLATDFAEVRLDGSFSAPSNWGTGNTPATWLSTLEGAALASLDLPLMSQRLPGFLPLRAGTELIAGRILAEITSHPDPSRPPASGARLVNAVIKSEPLRARGPAGNWVIEPASLVAAMTVDPSTGQWRADRCELASVFGTANLDGELKRGRARADIDLSRLAVMLESLVDLPELRLGGVAAGQLEWAAEAGNRWSLRGDGQATELTILLPGGIQLHRPTLTISANANGRVEGTQLVELTAAGVSLRSNSLEADATLVAAVARPTTETALPLHISSRGRLEVLAEFLGPWMPTSLHSLQGGYDARTEALVSLAGGQLSAATLRLEEPRGGWNDQYLAQHQLGVDFDGTFEWPSQNLIAKSLTITSESVSAVAKGQLTDQVADLEFAWRASLERLQQSIQSRVANQPWNTPGRLASATPPSKPEAAAWTFRGFCEGNGTIRRQPGESKIAVMHRAQANQFQLLEAMPASRSGTGSVLWAEPNIGCDADFTYDLASGQIESENLKLQSEWLAATLRGQARWDDAQGLVRLGGPARIDMSQVATRLTTLAGTPIRLQGIHETPIDIGLTRAGQNPSQLQVLTSLGWEAGEIAGLRLGACSIPIKLSETTVAIDATTIPIDEGQLNVAADLQYSPGPPWLVVRPGATAQNIRLTPELTGRWIQYLAPMMANATQVEGSFGVELSEARVNLQEPAQSQVRGQLQISQIRFDSGPVSEQLIGSIQQIKMLSRGRSFAEAQAENAARTQPFNLLTLPTQSVNFDLTQGVVTHQRMFMDADRVRIITSGQVSVEGRLNLVAQVPLDESWLGSDLKKLAGATVTLPIAGTLSQPRLDPSAIRNIATELGTKVIQKTAEDYLQEQLNRGFDRLLGK